MKKLKTWKILTSSIVAAAIGLYLPFIYAQQKASDKYAQTGSFIPAGSIMPYAGSTAPSGWVLAYGQEVSQTGTYAKLYAAIGSTYCTTDHGGTCTGGNFRLPDLRGRNLTGKDNMGGVAINRITAAATIDGTVLGKSGGNQSALPHYHGLGTGATLAVDINHDHSSFSTDSGGSHSHTYGISGFSYSNNPGGDWAVVGLSGDNSGAHTHSIDVPSFSGSKTPTGSIGLVTGGCDGNSTTACNNLSPTVIVNYIIKI